MCHFSFHLLVLFVFHINKTDANNPSIKDVLLELNDLLIIKHQSKDIIFTIASTSGITISRCTTWDSSGNFFSFFDFLSFVVACLDLVHDVEAIHDLCCAELKSRTRSK